MKIGVLGAGGFIGSHIVDTMLASTTHDVVAFDVTDAKLSHVVDERVTVHRAAFDDDPELVESIVAECDVVVDLIAHANPSLYVSEPLAVFDTSFRTNLQVIDWCAAHTTPLIQYSSSEVYGRPLGTVFSEDETELVMGPVTKQRWIYAASKQLLERVLHAHGLAGSLQYIIVRPFNFIGPRIDYLVGPGTTGGPRVFAHFMSALLTGGPMYLVDGGRVHRAFTHIDDAMSAFRVLLENEGSWNQIYNVGNPENDTSIIDLARHMRRIYEELTGRRPTSELVEIDGEDFYGSGYEDTTRVVPDIAKMRALGWEPKYDLDSTLRDAISYYLDPAHQAIG